MKIWKRPSHYLGETWNEYYVFLTVNRDSDCLERSNYECAIKEISEKWERVGKDYENGLYGYLPYDDLPYQEVKENHFLCGWIGWIAIHKDCQPLVELAETLEKRLDDYPILNEEHYSQLENDEAYRYWESCNTSDRIEMCKKHHVSIFASRRDEMPDTNSGELVTN